MQMFNLLGKPAPQAQPPGPRVLRRPRSAPPAQDIQPIYFYHKDAPYYEFTNFYSHPIRFNGFTYPTAEHLFQAMKFMSTKPALSERIRRLPTPREALELATRHRHEQRADWFQVNTQAMDAVLASKFGHGSQLASILLETGQREIYEDSPVDSFWGIGKDRQGRNELGKALMRRRAQLRSGQSPRLVAAPLPPPATARPVHFFDRHGEYYHLSNQSTYSITYNNKIYPTATHLYHSLKFPDHEDLSEHIRTQPSPESAQSEARRLKEFQQVNWYDAQIGYMELVLSEKFAQHPELKKVLRSTGTRELRYTDPNDYMWGTGKDGTGRNELGQALMRLRANLKP